MKSLRIWIKRNVKLFFKDKGLFFTSLITPAILLVLYITFLEKVYRDSFGMALPGNFLLSEDIIDAVVGGQLISSLLAVSCVTVAFCSNMLMVQDKLTGAGRDIGLSPVPPHLPALSYYLSTLAVTVLIALVAVGGGFVYLGVMGWYLSVADVLLLLLDVFLLVMFGTVLSSIINFFLSSQGQISAVGTIVSSGYGFLCGAYMPISQFPEGLQRVISFLPGTYGTSLLRNHAMRGALEAMKEEGVPQEIVELIRDSIDCNLYFFDTKVEEWVMFAILGGSVALLLAVYILLNLRRAKQIV